MLSIRMISYALYIKLNNHGLNKILILFLSVLQVRMINDRLLQIDRAFINKQGLPGMPFLR